MNIVRQPGCNLDMIVRPNWNGKIDRERFRNAEAGLMLERPIGIWCEDQNIADAPLMKGSVDEFLTEIDRGIKEIASTIGGSVVKHDWLLVFDPNVTHRKGRFADNFGFEDGVSLGAIVTVIEGVPLNLHPDVNNIDILDTIDSTLEKGVSEFGESNGWAPYDIDSARQYMAPIKTDECPVLLTRGQLPVTIPKSTCVDLDLGLKTAAQLKNYPEDKFQ